MAPAKRAVDLSIVSLVTGATSLTLLLLSFDLLRHVVKILDVCPLLLHLVEVVL